MERLTNFAAERPGPPEGIALALGGGFARGFARDTHQLAIDTHELRRTVEERDSSDADVQTAFDKVSRSFHAVRDEVNHADLEGVQRDFHPVANDYRDLRSELGESPDREARADYPPPPVER